jgi:hypothetical protein
MERRLPYLLTLRCCSNQCDKLDGETSVGECVLASRSRRGFRFTE